MMNSAHWVGLKHLKVCFMSCVSQLCAQALHLTKILTAALVCTVQTNLKDKLKLNPKVGPNYDMVVESLQRQASHAPSACFYSNTINLG